MDVVIILRIARGAAIVADVGASGQSSNQFVFAWRTGGRIQGQMTSFA
jgi:hypothetical protein